MGHDSLGFRDAFGDKLRQVVLDVTANSFVKVDVIGLLAIDATFFDDSYSIRFSRRTTAGQEIGNLPLMKLRPDHSTCVVTTTLLDTLLAHMIHVLVLTENTFPLGTSGVRVVFRVET